MREHACHWAAHHRHPDELPIGLDANGELHPSRRRVVSVQLSDEPRGVAKRHGA